MSYVDWKLHGDETVAAYLPDTALRGVLEKRIAVAPDCAAIVIRDGKVVESLRGAHLSVGGLWQKLKETLGGSHALRVLIADLKPFPLVVPLAGFSSDHVEIAAELALELAVNPERPFDIMGLMPDSSSLLREDIYARIRPHLGDRVLVHELVRHAAAELRANRGLQDRIQADLMQEVERIAGDLGLLVRAASVNWGLNAEEAQQIQLRTLAREERMRDFGFERARRELERAAQTTVVRLSTQFDIDRVTATNEADLARLLQNRELELVDARSAGERLEQRRALRHELEVAQERRNACFGDRLAEETNELERKRIELERRRAEMAFDTEMRRQELEIRKLEQLQALELDKLAKMQGLELDQLGKVQDLDLAGKGHDLQLRKLRDLQALELEKERLRHDRAKEDFLTQHSTDMDRRLHQSQSEMDKLRLQATMNPDQILAIQAGASPEVARVFAEKARASGTDREALLREMLQMSKDSKTQSEAQAREMFDRAVDRLAEVGSAAAAAGRGGKAEANEAAGGSSECPECHFQVPVAHRFCKNCGHQMRT